MKRTLLCTALCGIALISISSAIQAQTPPDLRVYGKAVQKGDAVFQAWESRGQIVLGDGQNAVIDFGVRVINQAAADKKPFRVNTGMPDFVVNLLAADGTVPERGRIMRNIAARPLNATDFTLVAPGGTADMAEHVDVQYDLAKMHDAEPGFTLSYWLPASGMGKSRAWHYQNLKPGKYQIQIEYISSEDHLTLPQAQFVPLPGAFFFPVIPLTHLWTGDVTLPPLTFDLVVGQDPEALGTAPKASPQ